MNENKNTIQLLVLSALVAFTLLAPDFFSGRAIMTENHRFRKHYSVGAYAPFKEGNSALWTEKFNFGTPRFSNPLLINYYPLDYLGIIIPEPYQSYFIWFFSLWLGIFGAYRLFALFTKRPPPAFMAGVIFVFSGVMYGSASIGLTVERIPFLAWTLYFVVRGTGEKNLIFLLVGAFLHGVHFFAGSASYLFFYASALIGIFISGYGLNAYFAEHGISTIYRSFPGIIKNVVVFFVPAFFLIGVLVLPVNEMMKFASHRFVLPGDIAYSHSGSLPLRELAFLPFLFSGVFDTGRQFESFVNLSYLGFIPMALALTWFFNQSWRNLILICAALLLILMAAASVDPVNSLLRNPLSPLRTIRHSAVWMVAWNLLFLWGAAKALESLGEDLSYRKALRSVGIILGFALGGLVLLFLVHKNSIPYISIPNFFQNVGTWNWGPALKPLLLGSVLLALLWGAWRLKISRNNLILIVCILAIVDAYSWTFKYSFFSEDDRKTAGIYNRFWNEQIHSETIPGIKKIPAPGEGRALVFGLPDELEKLMAFLSYLQHLEKVQPATSIPLRRGFAMAYLMGWDDSKLREAGQVFSGLTLSDFISSEKLFYARASNVKYYYSSILLPDKLLTEFQFKRRVLDRRLGMYMYEDTQTLSRAHIFHKIRSVGDFGKAYFQLKGNPGAVSKTPVVEIKPGSEPAWLKRLSGPINSGSAAGSSARLVRYSPEQVEIEATLSEPGLLYLSDVVYPGWRAYVDGKRVTIYPANLIGRGVFLESGRHKIIFEFHSESYLKGMALTVVCLLAYLALAAFGLFRFYSKYLFQREK